MKVRMFDKWFKRYHPMTQQDIALHVERDSALYRAIVLMIECAFEAGYRRGRNSIPRHTLAQDDWNK